MKGKPDIFGVWERSVIIGHLLFPKNSYWGTHCFRFYFLEHDVSFHVNLYENKTYGKYKMCNPRESVLFGFAAWLTEESRAWVSGVKPRPPPPPLTGLAQFPSLCRVWSPAQRVKTWCTRLWRDSGCSTPGPGSARPPLRWWQAGCSAQWGGSCRLVWSFYNRWRIFLYEMYIVGFLEI